MQCISMWKPQDLYVYFHFLLGDIQTLLLFYCCFLNANSTETFHFAGRRETFTFQLHLEELDFDKFILLFSHGF